MANGQVTSFLELADEELNAAKTLAAKNPRQAAYQLSQSAEKASRAVLAHEGIASGTTHNFGGLSVMLPDGHPMKSRINDFDRMSSASTRYRYPTPAGKLVAPPKPAALQHDIEDVERFVDDVKTFARNRVHAGDVKKRTTEPPKSEDERKRAFAEKVATEAELRDLEVPNDFVSLLMIYADERSLYEMTKLIRSCGSVKEMFEALSIRAPGVTEP
jgi:HEPN domain-containing protein